MVSEKEECMENQIDMFHYKDSFFRINLILQKQNLYLIQSVCVCIYIYIYTHGVMVIILNEAIYFSHIFNTLGKGLNLTILSLDLAL